MILFFYNTGKQQKQKQQWRQYYYCLLLFAHDKMRSGADLRGDLNGDNLRRSTAYLRISDHCSFRVRVANCCIQTAGERDKMRINHVIKTDQWRCAPQIRPAPHFVVSHYYYHHHFICSSNVNTNTLDNGTVCEQVIPGSYKH